MSNFLFLCKECNVGVTNEEHSIRLCSGTGCCRGSYNFAYFCSDKCKHQYATTKICSKCNRNDDLHQVQDKNGNIFMLCNWYGKSPTCYEQFIGKICNEFCDFCKDTCGDMNYINIDLIEGNNYIQYYFVCDSCYDILLNIVIGRKQEPGRKQMFEPTTCVFCKRTTDTRELRVPLCSLCKKIYDDIVCVEIV